MKKIILYRSKHGGAKKIAQRLQCECSEYEIATLENTINIEEYDSIVFGCGIYAGMIDKTLKQFIQDHEPILAKKKVMLYISGISKDSMEKECNDNFSDDFLSKVYYKDKLGAQINFPEFNFFEKQIIKMVNKKGNFITKNEIGKCVDLLDDEAINAFIEKMKQA